jgi:ribonuclease inhibitor
MRALEREAGPLCQRDARAAGHGDACRRRAALRRCVVGSAMRRELDGARCHSEADFHRQVSSLLGFGVHYGHNLDALWDRLSADVERPLTLVWKDSAISRARLGDTFDAIVAMLRRVEQQDEDWGLADRFDFVLV